MEHTIAHRKLRLKIYKAMYKAYKKRPINFEANRHYRKELNNGAACFGLCTIFERVRHELSITGHTREVDYTELIFNKTNFPEIFSYKPKTGWERNSRFWWTVSIERGGLDRRLGVLERVAKGLSKHDKA